MKVLIRPARYDAIGGPIEEILDSFSLRWKGARVLVKPNVLGPWTADAGVTTHPSVVAALVRALAARGVGKIMVGDNPGLRGYAENERCFRTCGLMEAAGGQYVNLGRSPVKVKFNSRYASEVTVSKEVLDCDILVSVPKFKTHALTMLTGAVKNTYGYIVGAEKALLHAAATSPERFGEVVADVYAVRPPDLSIMDAVVCMEGKGPSGGALRQAGKLIASDNAVCLDAVMCSMAGVAPEKIPTLRIAHARGFGEIDLSKIEVDGPLEPIRDFSMPGTFTAGLFGYIIHRFVFPRLRTKPRFNMRTCTRCKACYELCPVKAISWDDGPVLKREKCISCFCCMESCPSNAVELRGVLYKVRDALTKRTAGGPCG
ncbi:MAG: DUF362 domain-containing protein [Candidatus Aureabacteria bacterium]|nr:DUF362 domain-containing protein [Candidatus Auribacterota bacterium]NLW95170.1 DUF362 domain-containing protein [Chlamydiota bacterium]HOE28201.1 DUF362 domain-containing protein [bacterium]HQM53643.1 DUF362 domain-containing protein [bacterium]